MAAFFLLQKIPELWFPVPLEMSMKTYLKTNCSFTRNCLLSGLRFVTAPLLTCLAALFISVTTPEVTSGLSANADAPRRTFITSTSQVPSQVQYMVIELGGRRANDISQSGQIVGSKASAPELYHAAFWASSQSAPIDLGSLPGLRSTATGINPRREIVGYASNEDFSVERPLFWASTNSAPVELPGLPAGFLSEVYDINPSGHIVGQFYSADFSVERAVFWPNSNAAPVYLRQLSDEFPASLAHNINASGNILGDACDTFNCAEDHAVFWANSTSTPVALASPGDEFIYTDIVLPGQAINGAGNMVGYAHNADFSAERAVFWASSSTPAVILSTVGEFTNAVAAGISDNGQIVGIGYNEDFSKSRPFIWPRATSQAIDLTTILSGWLQLGLGFPVHHRR